MSYSSIWTIDKKLYGKEDTQFKNSFLFAPIVLNLIFWKYLPEKSYLELGPLNRKVRTSYITACITKIDGDDSPTIFSVLNEKMKKLSDLDTRILWELCHGEIFFIKDRERIADAILSFLEKNPVYDEKPIPDHIKERFLEISNAIKNLSDENKYFVFKNSSSDDDVERWFGYYDEDDNYIDEAIGERNKEDVEWAKIENDTIKFLSLEDILKEVL